MPVSETSDIATDNHTPCPNHDGQSYNKSTGDCSCGSNHHRWASKWNPGGLKRPGSVCDATLDRDSAGVRGRFDAIVSGPDGAETQSVWVGECSDDRVQIWHGMSTPAIACGKHATSGIGRGPVISVFRGHRYREQGAK